MNVMFIFMFMSNERYCQTVNLIYLMLHRYLGLFGMHRLWNVDKG